MQDIISKVKYAMIKFNSGDPKRIAHLLKVHSLAKLIGECECLNSDELFILEIAALTHDIGIRICEQKYGSCTGKLQEKEGAAPARIMLSNLGIQKEVIDRVCFLIAHHHTYDEIDGLDYQILVEADFLVNLHEDNCTKAAIDSAVEKIFKTKSGIKLSETIFQ